MGNAGITVYNSSDYLMNVYLSMGASHHYCNRLAKNEAFTIYPGAVWYTVGCFLSNEKNDITDGRIAVGISMIAVPAVLGVATGGIGLAAGLGSAAAATVVLPGLTTLGETVFGGALSVFGSTAVAVVAEAVAIGGTTASAVSAPALVKQFMEIAGSCEWQDNVKGIYCGGKHKIVVISGGPYMKNNSFLPCNIKISESTAESIPAGIRYRKKNGLYNDDYEYWEESDKKWYPPNNFRT